MVMVCFLSMKLSYYVPLNVQTQCWAWIKLVTDNFSTVLTRNLRSPRDHAPLKFIKLSIRTRHENERVCYICRKLCYTPGIVILDKSWLKKEKLI